MSSPNRDPRLLYARVAWYDQMPWLDLLENVGFLSPLGLVDRCRTDISYTPFALHVIMRVISVMGVFQFDFIKKQADNYSTHTYVEVYRRYARVRVLVYESNLNNYLTVTEEPWHVITYARFGGRREWIHQLLRFFDTLF